MLFDYCCFYISAYTTVNKSLAVFIYNIYGFIEVRKVTEQLLCTQQQQLLLLLFLASWIL